MGVVYGARDTRLDRDVAIKVLPEACRARWIARLDARSGRPVFETGRPLAGGAAGASFGLAHLEAAAGNVGEPRRLLEELTGRWSRGLVSTIPVRTDSGYLALHVFIARRS